MNPKIANLCSRLTGASGKGRRAGGWRLATRVLGMAGVMGVLGTMSTLGGCAAQPELLPPEQVVSPYPISRGEVLLAVAPLRNESGTSTADALGLTDALAQRLDAIEGVTCIPTNRVIQAQRALGMNSISSPADARRLLKALGTDGLVVGTITAYDPYDPPKLGLTLALFGTPGGRLDAPGTAATGDPTALRMSGSGAGSGGGAGGGIGDQPLATVSEMLDARGQDVQMNVKRYAEGRSEAKSALGWRSYLANMELYNQFGGWWTVYRLMQEERLRVSRGADAERRGK